LHPPHDESTRRDPVAPGAVSRRLALGGYGPPVANGPAMKRTLRLHREALAEITAPELTLVRGGTTPFATDGHHCFGTGLCVRSIDARCLTLEGCMTPPNTTNC
jgi:hypothetical protein